MSMNKTELNKIAESSELKDILNKYQGVLPRYLLLIIDYNTYIDNLNDVDGVEEEYYKRRCERKKAEDKKEYDEKEYSEWLKNNPRIEELISNFL